MMGGLIEEAFIAVHALHRVQRDSTSANARCRDCRPHVNPRQDKSAAIGTRVPYN